MKRTTIFVPEELERDLQLYARRAGKPTAVVVREALTAFVARKRAAADLPSFAAAFDSGVTDTAEHHEDMLFARLAPHEDAAVPGARRAIRRRSAARKRR
jgi:predicted transcriptional regulator